MEVEDKMAILELLSRYAYGLDAAELDMVEATFAPDARMAISIAGRGEVGPFEGREAIMGLMRKATEERRHQRRHVITNAFVAGGDENEADVVSNLTLLEVEDGRLRLVTTGIYRDRVRRTAAGWRFVERDLALDLPY